MRQQEKASDDKSGRNVNDDDQVQDNREDDILETDALNLQEE